MGCALVNAAGRGERALEEQNPKPGAGGYLLNPPAPVGRGAGFVWSELVLNGGSQRVFKMAHTGLFKRDVSGLSLTLLGQI